MRKEATPEQWRALYAAAEIIGEMEPWREFSDTQLFRIKEKESGDVYSFSMMGKAEKTRGFAAYRGESGYNDFLRILSNTEIGISERYAALDQTCLAGYYGNGEEIPPEQLWAAVEYGGYLPGEDGILYFTSYKSGYYPYLYDEDEVVRMTGLLKLLRDAIDYYHEYDIDVAFEKMESFAFYYDKKKECWTGTAMKLPFAEFQYQEIDLCDELLKRRLKRQPFVEVKLELMAEYMGIRLEDKAFDRPVSPRIILLADRDSHMVVGQHIVAGDDDIKEWVLNVFIDFINQAGKPVQLFVDNYIIKGILESVCHESGVELIMESELPAAREAFETVLEKLNGRL